MFVIELWCHCCHENACVGLRQRRGELTCIWWIRFICSYLIQKNTTLYPYSMPQTPQYFTQKITMVYEKSVWLLSTHTFHLDGEETLSLLSWFIIKILFFGNQRYKVGGMCGSCGRPPPPDFWALHPYIVNLAVLNKHYSIFYEYWHFSSSWHYKFQTAFFTRICQLTPTGWWVGQAGPGTPVLMPCCAAMPLSCSTLRGEHAEDNKSTSNT